ncbi:MAG: T9SS type A sorting domain-containing protein, partial [Bacteroidota bacterium]
KVFTNIIQIKTIRKELTAFTYSGTPGTYSDTYTTFDYYHASQRFPLLSVSYDYYVDQSGPSLSANITVNKIITVGLKNQSFDNAFSIFPNPAKDILYFQMDNLNAENCSLEMIDVTGNQVKLIEYDNNTVIKDKVNISDLPKGLYFLKTTSGEKSKVQKLLVD